MDFLNSEGYVPLVVAYGMEEVDLCMRLTNKGKKIYFSPWLRIFHDTELAHHASATEERGYPTLAGLTIRSKCGSDLAGKFAGRH